MSEALELISILLLPKTEKMSAHDLMSTKGLLDSLYIFVK